MNLEKILVLLSRYRTITWMHLEILKNLESRLAGISCANKKTFLMIHAMEAGNRCTSCGIEKTHKQNPDDKVSKTLEIFRACGVDKWAIDLKEKYIATTRSNISKKLRCCHRERTP